MGSDDDCPAGVRLVPRVREDPTPDRAAVRADVGPAPAGADCPAVDELERLVAGAVPPGDADRIEAHLRACPDCAQVRAGIAAEPLPVNAPDPPLSRSMQEHVERLAAHAPASEPEPEPEPSIEGYDRFELIGRGGMGIVWRAREVRLDRAVAIKVLSRVAAMSPKARGRAEHEARVLARISHPNVVRVLTLATSDEAPAIVMEWIEGVSLHAWATGPVAVHTAAALVRDLASAVSTLHAAGIVHRDITPANILMVAGPNGTQPHPVLVDFGLAVGADETTPEGVALGAAVGTPAFMAPEQTGLDAALDPIGPATDVHGLGAVLHWLLSGKAPYEGATATAMIEQAIRGPVGSLPRHVPRIHPDVVSIVDTCLARQPRLRYRSAEALADDLTRVLEGRPIRARRAGAAERCLRWARRRPVAAALVGCGVIATLVGAAASAHHVRSLGTAAVALRAKHDEAVATAALARESFERLTDSTAERFLARGTALDAADRDHLRQIRDRYLSWPLEPDENASLRFRATGLTKVATLFNRLAWLDDALDTTRRARECLEEIERRGIATAGDVRKRCVLQHAERTMLAKAGRLDEAIGATRAAIASHDHSGDSSDPLDGELAMAWGDLGNLEGSAGNLGAARHAHGQAVAILDRLVAAAPDDVDAASQSLTVLYNAAISPALDDDRPARRELFVRLVERAEAGLGRFPAAACEFGHRLLLGLHALAHCDFEEGRVDEALAAARRRGDIARRLAEELPASQSLIDQVIGAAVQSGHYLLASGRPAEAWTLLEEADALAARAVAAEPAIRQRTWVLLEVLVARASTAIALGRRAEAIDIYSRLSATVRPWEREGVGTEQFPVRVADVEAAIASLRREEDLAAEAPHNDVTIERR